MPNQCLQYSWKCMVGEEIFSSMLSYTKYTCTCTHVDSITFGRTHDKSKLWIAILVIGIFLYITDTTNCIMAILCKMFKWTPPTLYDGHEKSKLRIVILVFGIFLHIADITNCITDILWKIFIHFIQRSSSFVLSPQLQTLFVPDDFAINTYLNSEEQSLAIETFITCLCKLLPEI